MALDYNAKLAEAIMAGRGRCVVGDEYPCFKGPHYAARMARITGPSAQHAEAMAMLRSRGRCPEGHQPCFIPAHYQPKLPKYLTPARAEKIAEVGVRVATERQCLLGHPACPVEAHFVRVRARTVSQPATYGTHGPARRARYEPAPAAQRNQPQSTGSELVYPLGAERLVPAGLLPGQMYRTAEASSAGRTLPGGRAPVRLGQPSEQISGAEEAELYGAEYVELPGTKAIREQLGGQYLAVAHDVVKGMVRDYVAEDVAAESEERRIARFGRKPGDPITPGPSSQEVIQTGERFPRLRGFRGPGFKGRSLDSVELEEVAGGMRPYYTVQARGIDTLLNSFVKVGVTGARIDLKVPILGANEQKRLLRAGKVPPTEDEQIMGAVRAWWEGNERELDILTLVDQTPAQIRRDVKEGKVTMQQLEAQAEQKRGVVRAYWRAKT
jgi:hypothetical protein